MIDLDDVELWPEPPPLLERIALDATRIEPGTTVAVLVRSPLAVEPAQTFALLTQARTYAESAGFRFEFVQLPTPVRRRWWQRLMRPLTGSRGTRHPRRPPRGRGYPSVHPNPSTQRRTT